MNTEHPRDSLLTSEYVLLAPDGSEWMRVCYSCMADAINAREFNGQGKVVKVS